MPKKLLQLSLLIALSGTNIFSAELQVTEARAKHAAIAKPAPMISPLARQMKIIGRVEVDVIVAEDGSVSDVKLTVGPPLLGAGVIAAVKRWKFTPFTNSSAVPVTAMTTLTFQFKQ